MNSRDACVPDTIHSITHRFGRQCGLLRDGNVARAGRDNCNRANTVIGFVTTDAYESSGFVPFSVSDYVANLAKRAFVRAGNENVWRALDKSFDYSDDLRTSLAAAKDDFREALS